MRVKPVKTVGELRAYLQSFSDDTPIGATWESCNQAIYPFADETGVVLDVDGGWLAEQMTEPENLKESV
jgi:hypothetical protein